MSAPIFHDAPELGASGVYLRAQESDQGVPPRIVPLVIVDIREGVGGHTLFTFPALYLVPLHDLLGKLIAQRSGT